MNEGMEGSGGVGAAPEGGRPDGELSGGGDIKAQRTFSEGGTDQSQFVPYSRFQEVNGKYRDLESKYYEIQKTLEDMKKASGPDPDKEFESKFYKNPVQTMREFVKEHIEGLKAEGTKKEQEMQRASAIKWFREQPDYTPELEEKAARFITENGLQGLDPQKAIKLAHQFVTMGDGSGYTRQVKEGLKKPGAGGKGKGESAQDELSKLDPKDPDYEEKMKQIHAKITGR